MGRLSLLFLWARGWDKKATTHCCSSDCLNSSSGGELKLYLKWKRNKLLFFNLWQESVDASWRVHIEDYSCITRINFFKGHNLMQSAVSDLRGRQRLPPPEGPNTFIFRQFSAKKGLAHPLWELAPPPQENPGSATDLHLY